MSTKKKTIRIILSILFTAAVALLGSYFTDTDSAWYQNLSRPALQPPAIVFPIVWSVLYALFAASLAISAVHPETTKKTQWLYAMSGVLNVLWSYVFFARQNPGGALIVLALLIITAVLLFWNVCQTSKTAAYLLLPYIVWLFFAFYLNYEIAFLN